MAICAFSPVHPTSGGGDGGKMGATGFGGGACTEQDESKKDNVSTSQP